MSLTLLALAITMLFQSAVAQFAPAPHLRTLDWCIRYVHNENGRPYDHGSYPHLGAPGGPCDANDDPSINETTLQFATRLGKTFFGQCVHMHAADDSPAPGMFVSSVEKVATDVVARTYRLIEQNVRLRHQLLREDRRKGDRIELDRMKIFVGWARSVSTLADKNVKIGHGNELDKWERLKTSTEGDPLDLFRDRSKDFPNYKYIFESTPTVKDVSRIEKLLLESSNCRYFVPCPHCKKYQQLKMSRLTWSKTPSGKHSADLALKTAHYVCQHCDGAIHDHHRHPMMRLGVWVPEGCGIDHERALAVATDRWQQIRAGTFSHKPAGRYWQHDYATGTPTHDSNKAGYQLSSLYALSLTWGRIAAEWVSVHATPARLWNFINQWLGETWVPKKRTEDWRKVAERLMIAIPRGVVPAWASLMTCGIDRQLDHYKWLVEAWGPGDRSHVVDYGSAPNLDWVYQNVLARGWKYEDRGELKVSGTLIDCGYEPKDPCELSKKCLAKNPREVVLVCRGSSSKLYLPFKMSTMGPETTMPGLPNVMVDGDWTQTEIDKQLHDLAPGSEGSTSIFELPSIDGHEDFVKELLNEEPVVKLDKANHESVTWQRANENLPNDHRDTKRYSFVAKLVRTGGKPVKPRVVKVEPTNSRPQPRRVTMPDGRPYLPI